MSDIPGRNEFSADEEKSMRQSRAGDKLAMNMDAIKRYGRPNKQAHKDPVGMMKRMVDPDPPGPSISPPNEEITPPPAPVNI